MKRLTNQQFLDRAHKIHGDKYTYLSVYVNLCSKIDINCSTHGLFKQSPEHHLRGHNCPKCMFVADLKSFIAESNIVHNCKYDYSLSNYIGSITKIKIICPIHGVFKQQPDNHLSGKGCSKCGGNVKSNIETFVNKAKLIHDNKYNYSQSIYLTAKIKLKIICPIHGIFEQSPNAHLSGKGCKECIRVVSKLETQWLDHLNLSLECRQISLKIGNKLIRTDAFDPTSNTIYEFYGDYYHGNPQIYDANKINHKNKKTFAELYNQTILRENIIKTAGYNLISIWENEWKNEQKRTNKNIKTSR